MSAIEVPERHPYLVDRSTVAVGIDLGQSKDPTSIAVVEKIEADVPDNADARMVSILKNAARKARPHHTHYNLRLLEQAPLGEPYPVQAQRINSILGRPAIAQHDPKVFVDYTGVGRAVYDIFKQHRVPRIVPVTITFQGGGRNEAGGYSVPKIDLISKLQALMHTGKLRMPDTLPLAKTFRRELLDFRVSYSAVGNATFGAREGAHDDLILAVALAVYGLDSGREATVQPLNQFLRGVY
jgi:hypothetical protein